MAPGIRFYFGGYQKKGEPYRDALLSAGYIQDDRHPDFLLIDREQYINSYDLRSCVLAHPGVPVMIYPHSAMPPWWYDGLVGINPAVRRIFVMGEGQKRATAIFAPGARVSVTGWSWCEQREFQRPDKVRNILFAPIHPTGGRLRPEAARANNAVFGALGNTDYNVTVRYIGALLRQGLRPEPRFNMIAGAANSVTDEIDAADLVIAEGTMIYLSVARGKPTIGINQDMPIRTNLHYERYQPRNWDKWGPATAYPLNFGDKCLRAMIDEAMTEQSEWRQDFIGQDMTPADFVAEVERALNDEQ